MFFSKKKRRMADRLLTKTVRQIIPESESYMELLEVEKKLDLVLMRKRLTLQESLKQPLKVCIFCFSLHCSKAAVIISTFFFQNRRKGPFVLCLVVHLNLGLLILSVPMVSRTMMALHQVGNWRLKVSFLKRYDYLFLILPYVSLLSLYIYNNDMQYGSTGIWVGIWVWLVANFLTDFASQFRPLIGIFFLSWIIFSIYGWPILQIGL